MVKCTFCGKEEIQVRGIHLITNEGSILYFCSSKCRKNALKLKRDKRKIKWTEEHRITLRKSQARHAKEKKQAEETEKR